MSIWERLSEATRNLSVGGQISSLFGFGSTSQARKAYSEPDNEVPFTVGVIVPPRWPRLTVPSPPTRSKPSKRHSRSLPQR